MLSEGAWKSTVVKSLRMGWPEGLRVASQHLAPSTVKRLLVSGLFEDVFPPETEFDDCLGEIERRDYDALCSRETLHGRGYAERYCDISEWPEPSTWLPAVGRTLGLYVPEYMAGNVWAWQALEPKDEGVRRHVDPAVWTEMPAAMLDGHTREGHRRRTLRTILSGDVDSHRRLGRMVMAVGWDPVRQQAHE